MPIPAFEARGLLPSGVHLCTLEEARERFGSFDRSDRRVRLFQQLLKFLGEATATGMVQSVIIDGSFVTDEPEPKDIDLILVLRTGHDFLAELRPFEYNVLSKRQVRRRHGFDVLVAREGSQALADYVEFFQGMRDFDEVDKGLIQVMR